MSSVSVELAIMDAQELLELREKSSHHFERRIGVTMAVFAALLAAVTLMGHRLHTEEVVLQTKTADGWAYFQAKNSRAQMYAADATLAELQGANGQSAAAAWKTKAESERKDAEDIRHENEALDHETQTAARRATRFDGAEICLEVAIVLCSIGLLTGAGVYWQLSFVPALLGLALAATGVFLGGA